MCGGLDKHIYLFVYRFYLCTDSNTIDSSCIGLQDILSNNTSIGIPAGLKRQQYTYEMLLPMSIVDDMKCIEKESPCTIVFEWQVL